MEASEYQAAAAKTECDQLKARVRMYGVGLDWGKGGGENTTPPPTNSLLPVRLNHAVVGMTGEIGEVAALVENWVYYGLPLDRAAFVAELGDILWYVAEACNALGLDMGLVMENNLAKLRKRFPEGYNGEAARRENRDIEGEIAAAQAAARKSFAESLYGPRQPYTPRPADHPRPYGYEPDGEAGSTPDPEEGPNYSKAKD